VKRSTLLQHLRRHGCVFKRERAALVPVVGVEAPDAKARIDSALHPTQVSAQTSCRTQVSL